MSVSEDESLALTFTLDESQLSEVEEPEEQPQQADTNRTEVTE